jgi:hypothetical protein
MFAVTLVLLVSPFLASAEVVPVLASTWTLSEINQSCTASCAELSRPCVLTDAFGSWPTSVEDVQHIKLVADINHTCSTSPSSTGQFATDTTSTTASILGEENSELFCHFSITGGANSQNHTGGAAVGRIPDTDFFAQFHTTKCDFYTNVRRFCPCGESPSPPPPEMKKEKKHVKRKVIKQKGRGFF